MRRAFTLLELIVVCAIIGIAAGIVAPRIARSLDSIAVESAAREVIHAFSIGRLSALRGRGAEMRIDSTTVSVRTEGRIVHERNVRTMHGVRLRATTALVRYASTGLGTGLSNTTVYVTKGAVAETIYVSRLGRVRR